MVRRAGHSAAMKTNHVQKQGDVEASYSRDRLQTRVMFSQMTVAALMKNSMTTERLLARPATVELSVRNVSSGAPPTNMMRDLALGPNKSRTFKARPLRKKVFLTGVPMQSL
jgi:hypothetical protein